MVNVIVHVVDLDGKCVRATNGFVHRIYRAWSRGSLSSLFWTYCKEVLDASIVTSVGMDEVPNCLKCATTTEEEAGNHEWF